MGGVFPFSTFVIYKYLRYKYYITYDISNFYLKYLLFLILIKN